MPSSSNNGINNTVGASVSGVTNTLTIQNPSNTSSSAAQCLLTVGGTSSASNWAQWTVGSTRSWALGQNNSDSQKLYLNYNNSASVSPTTGTNMLFYDHATPGMFLGASQNVIFNTSGGSVGTAATNGVSIYEVGTYTPTLEGATTAGSTAYTTQLGYYVRYGNVAYGNATITITSATGTGNVRIGLPITRSAFTDVGSGPCILGATGWSYPSSNTWPTCFVASNAAYCNINMTGNSTSAANLSVTNAALTVRYSAAYGTTG